MPSTTRSVIISSGNYSNTLFISASNESLGIEPTSPLTEDKGGPTVQAHSNRSGLVDFAELPGVPAFNIRVNAVEGYRSVIRAAQKVAFTWREKRRMSTPAARWVQQNQSFDSSTISAAHKTTPDSRYQEKLPSTRRSRSFNLLSSLSRGSAATYQSAEQFDAIITYLPNSEASTSEVGLQALLRQFYTATTAFSTLFDHSRKVDTGPQTDAKSAWSSSDTTLIYVFPTNSPTSLPKTLQSYLTSLLSVNDQHENSPQVFLIKEKTLDRKMQRQEGRHPVTGLEIILSDSLRWYQPLLPSQTATLNFYLDDFKHCRFVTSPSFVRFDASSANASYSSLSNTTTTTTDGEPQTPTLSEDEDSAQVAKQVQIRSERHSEPYDSFAQSGSSTSTPELSIKSYERKPFLRRIFSGDPAKR